MPRGVPRNSDATYNPVVASSVLNTLDEQVGQDASRTLKSTGDAKEALSEAIIEPVDKPVDMEHLEMLKFFAEPVTIRITTTTDKNAEQIFEITVNGRREVFKRGETKTVPRYIVAKMASMKETIYTQREVVNNEGIKDILYDGHTGLKYDFAVVQDSHPRGAEWLRYALSAGG